VLCDSVLAAVLPERPDDDVALLVCPYPRTAGRSGRHPGRGPDPSAVADTRKSALGQLEAWGLDDAAFVTELIVSEMVTNAIRHAEPPIQLRLIHDPEPHLRGLGRQQHRTPHAPGPHLRRRRPRLNVHRDRRLRTFIDAHDWITVHYLPSYTPQLDPGQGIWSVLRRRCQANTDFTDPAHLMRALRRSLRQAQYQPDIIDGCLVGTGLTLTTAPLERQWWPDGTNCLKASNVAGSSTASRLTTESGSAPCRIRLIGTSSFFPVWVCGIAGT